MATSKLPSSQHGSGASSTYRHTIVGVVMVCLLLWAYDNFAGGRGGAAGTRGGVAHFQAAQVAGLQKAVAVAAPDDYGGESAPVPEKPVASPPRNEGEVLPEVPVPRTKRSAAAPKLVPADFEGNATMPKSSECFFNRNGCYPLFIRSGSLFVQRLPNQYLEPSVLRVGGIHAEPHSGAPMLTFSPNVKRIAIDIGTNTDPDTQSDWWDDKDIGMIWFEPIVSLYSHPMHEDRTRREMGIDSQRVFGIPAAAAPTPGHMGIFLSAVSGCTSLLEMNDHALKDPSVMKGSFVGSDAAFHDYSTTKVGFTGCIEKVSGRPNREVIPVIRAETIMNMIPPHLPIYFVATDAQGFDLHVVASFGVSLKRVDILLVECQDLPEGHGMFLTKGAFSCADVRECMKQYSPEHQMIAAATGQPADSCTINSPSHERNCLFRRMQEPWFHKTPKLLQRPAYEIKHPARANLECPSLAPNGNIATIADLKETASNWQPGDAADD